MSVKDALQSEMIPFIEAETTELESVGSASVNGEKFKWYDRSDGPPSIHEFTRSELDTASRTSIGGLSKGMGKIVADRIAAFQRLANSRNETRLQAFVRGQVRAAQRKLALEDMRDTALKRVTA